MNGVGLHDYKHEKYGDLIRSKVEEVINRGRIDVQTGLQLIGTEFAEREDLIVRPSALDYEIDDSGIHPVIEVQGKIMRRKYDLTPHASGQLLAKAKLPQTFADTLLNMDRALLRHNLRELLPKTSTEGVMLRHIHGNIKGVLSTVYRRMDSAPIFESFVKACIAKGMVPYRARPTDTRNVITFVFPHIFTPMVNANGRPEVILLGLQIMSSDYGKGALVVQMVIFRIWCANLAMGDNVLRKVHLGRRFEGLGEEDMVALSSKTIALDSATVASAMRDVVGQSDKFLGALSEKITAAGQTEISIEKAVESLKKKGLKKDTLEQVKTVFESEMPVEVLPQGSTAWRLSNTLSFLANSMKGDDQLELQAAAFAVVDPKAA